MTVRFGYGLITCQCYPGDARSDVDLHAEALGAAEDRAPQLRLTIHVSAAPTR